MRTSACRTRTQFIAMRTSACRTRTQYIAMRTSFCRTRTNIMQTSACRTSTNSRRTTSWYPQGLSRAVMGLFYVIRVILLAVQVFTHNCDKGKLSALIQCWNIVQQIERDGFQDFRT
jgi:hypothetical protein